jgi:hypothetical protein
MRPRRGAATPAGDGDDRPKEATVQQTIPSRPALNLAEWQTPTPPGYCHDCGRDCGFPGHLADDPRPDDAAEVIARAARHALLTEILPEDGALPPAMAGRVTARLAVLVRNFTTPAVTS